MRPGWQMMQAGFTTCMRSASRKMRFVAASDLQTGEGAAIADAVHRRPKGREWRRPCAHPRRHHVQYCQLHRDAEIDCMRYGHWLVVSSTAHHEANRTGF